MFFAGRGCGSAATDLASQTLDRAAEKLASSEEVESREPARYVFQVANFILLEHLRSHQASPLNADIAAAPIPGEENAKLRCCKQCLGELPEDDRNILQDYYLGEKKGEAKRIRGQVASELGVAQGALRIKVFRVKQKLLQCLSRCLESGEQRLM